MNEDRKELGKIRVTQRILKIDELENKVNFAIDSFRRAFEKYEQGLDSTHDWSLVIKALTLELEELREYIAVAHHNIGVLNAAKNNLAEAIENFSTALSFNTDYAVAHYNLAVVYRKIGDMENCNTHLSESKRLGFEPGKK